MWVVVILADLLVIAQSIAVELTAADNRVGAEQASTVELALDNTCCGLSR